MPPCRPLTERQVQILKLIAEGRTIQGVADDLGLSVHTVRNHVRESRRRLRARDTLQAVLTALRIGIIDPPGAGR